MAITAGLCSSYKQEILSGVHLSTDTYKIALYTNAATIGPATTAYTASGEVADGGGYSAGGIDLSGFTTSLDGTTAWIDFTSDPSWAASTITARGALIYNSTQSNKAVAVLDFGEDKSSSSGTFKVTFPAAAAATALIRLS